MIVTFLYIFASKESHKNKGEASQIFGQSVTNDTSTIGWEGLAYCKFRSVSRATTLNFIITLFSFLKAECKTRWQSERKTTKIERRTSLSLIKEPKSVVSDVTNELEDSGAVSKRNRIRNPSRAEPNCSDRKRCARAFLSTSEQESDRQSVEARRW